jgi:hypothetical protein
MQPMQTFKTEEVQKEQILVEVFKTDVDSEQVAVKIITDLQRIFPSYRINFDLDDCDKILRVESKSGNIEVERIIGVVRSFNNKIEAIQ